MKKIQSYSFFAAAVGLLAGVVILTTSLNSCSTLNALSGLSRIQFKLQDANQFRVAGIDVSNVHSVSDISISDGLNLLNAFRTGTFPVTFTLNVAAKNPNSATGTNFNALQLTNFPWRLMIDSHQTVSGNIGSAVAIPSGGTTQIIPLQISVDLKQFFADKGYNDLISLALSLAGQGTSHLQLVAQPTMSTPIGSLTYPNEITIVNTQFTS